MRPFLFGINVPLKRDESFQGRSRTSGPDAGLLVSCFVAGVIRMLSADLSCPCGLLWGCVSRPFLSQLLVKLQPKTPRLHQPGEEEGDMQRYHAKHQDPEAEALKPLRCLYPSVA